MANVSVFLLGGGVRYGCLSGCLSTSYPMRKWIYVRPMPDSPSFRQLDVTVYDKLVEINRSPELR